MAAEFKLSFLESISPWSLSRNATPQPTDGADKIEKEEKLQRSQGDDHAVGNQYRLSLKQYPRDCPLNKVRWFYAVDVPKRKPKHYGDSAKSLTPPKKFVPFSAADSQSIEDAFQALLDREGDSAGGEDITVPCQEDLLYDVNVQKRELGPAYWEGPVYDVRRASWFYQEGYSLRPCDENLANQLEEGYLKAKPWRNKQPVRSASQNRSRPVSLAVPATSTPSIEGSSSNQSTPKLAPVDSKPNESDQSMSSSQRLFGPYSSSTVTYQDATTAWLAADDFMSRMSTTVYQRFGALGGTKVVRGYTEPGKAKDGAENKDGAPDSKNVPSGAQDTATMRKSSASIKRKSAPPGSMPPPPRPSETSENGQDDAEGENLEKKRSTLERQISSLAGAGDSPDSEELAEEARKQEEKEMEDAREKDGEDPAREVDHLVLVTHGIGQRLGLRLDSINFIHNVNTLRKTLKTVYTTAPDLQALNSQFADMPKNCRIQVLPVCWRHLLDFPGQALKDNRKELDLGEADDDFDYPSLQDITVDGIPAVRNLISDLAMDVLLYQSAYREHIGGIVQQECNRIYKLFKQRNPNFQGRVSLCGHSLGSAIMFDILCRQKDRSLYKTRSRRTTGASQGVDELRLDFEVEKFFCLGSPIALFQMLKGRTIAGRDQSSKPADSPFDPDKPDPFSQSASYTPQTVSSPLCEELYNIFHPTDPIAYRMEPLISKTMSQLKPQQLPYTKKGLFGTAGIGARMGQSVNSLWSSVTSGVATSLLNRSLGITADDTALPSTQAQPSTAQPSHQRGKSLGNTTTAPSNAPTAAPQQPTADDKKQQQIGDRTLSAAERTSTTSTQNLPTLIDSEMETLYSGFQKSRPSGSNHPPPPHSDDLRNSQADLEWQEGEEQARRLRREEMKVKALNSNGRVDYSVQEGTFDISLLASIASHLSYWSDEDVNHFMISQILSKARRRPGSVV